MDGRCGDDTCRRAHEELARRARKFRKDVGLVAPEAREAGVPPLQIRSTLERHDIDL